MLDERSAFLQYYYSEEEVSARKEGYNSQITVLKAKQKNANFFQKIKIKKQIDDIKKKIKLEEANAENYRAIQRLRTNPNDMSLMFKQNIAQIKVDFIKNPASILLHIFGSCCCVGVTSNLCNDADERYQRAYHGAIA